MSREEGPDLDVPMAQPVLTRPLVSTLNWDTKSIIASSPNFHPVQRVHYTAPNARVDALISQVEQAGNPMIISGWNRHPRWPKAIFNIDWLKKNGDQNPTVRNVYNWADFKISMDDFIKRLRGASAYASPDEHERLYGKDIDCPAQWTDWLANAGAIPDDLLFHGANDFLKFLPDEAKVQTLMCYMGIGDTFTPFHKDLCASSGQNLMCFSEHSGSAIWFMTKSSAAPLVAAYFHQLGQELDLETHVVTIEELAKAPFDVYIAEQQLGDLVLVPPRSCHQVVNKGGITIKTSWSRMSLTGLQTALWHELPIYHRVCRQEIYKVKSNIFHALQHFTQHIEEPPQHHENKSLAILKQLVPLFDDILTAEVSTSRDSMPHVAHSGTSHADNLHCDFCGADIFQSFFECASCLPAPPAAASTGGLPVGDGLVLCPLCYVEGRTCQCEMMEPVQCRPFADLLEIRDQAVRVIQRVDNDYTDGYGYLVQDPLRLFSSQNANIFEAACKLFQRRQNDVKGMRSCRVRHSSHQVSAPAAIYCKLCHASRCYTHLLELDSVHSVDAITLSDGVDWHQSHRVASQQYQTIRQRVVEDEERGSRTNASHRLTYLAKTFTTCRAIALEVTKHGWYDRFAQTTTIPIAKSPAKALVRLPDDIEADEPYDSHPSDSPSTNLPVPTPNGGEDQTTDSRRISTPPGGVNEVQSPLQSSLSIVPYSHSRTVFPSSSSSKLEVFGSPTSPANRTQEGILNDGRPLTPPLDSHAAHSPMMTSHSSGVMDDGNLSDLTELTTDVDSPRALISRTTVPETPPQRSSLTLSLSPSSVPITFPNTPPVARSRSKSRQILDCVEVPHPEWYRGKEKSPSRRKRRRILAPSTSDIAGSANFDNPPLAMQEGSSRSLSRRKRKVSQGPASRSKHSHSFDIRDRPSQINPLANALNQTFQSNSTGPNTRALTKPRSFDAIPPVSDPVISFNVKPQHRDIGVQKDPNFTHKRISTTGPSKDPNNCLTILEAENRDLKAQAETFKRQCDVYRETLDEIKKRYHHGFWGPSRAPPPSTSGPSNQFPPQEYSNHPKWRTRSMIADNQFQSMPAHELEYPPIETLPLPTPSSPESPSARRRTPTEPRGFRTRGNDQGSNGSPNLGPRRHGRKRGPSEPTSGRRPREREGGRMGGGPSRSLSRGGRMARSPAASNSLAVAQAGVSGTLPSADAAVADYHDQIDQMPPSPPTTASDHAQPPKSPAVQ